MVAYNRDIPNTPNNPSTDQPKMKTNTNSIYTIIAVDHKTFESGNDGTHLQNTYEGFSAGAVLGLPASSTAYPAAGVKDNTKAQYYFKNSTTNFLISGLRAFALVTGSTGFIAGAQSLNCTVLRNSVGNYTVTITNAATFSTTPNTDYSVFVQVMSSSGFSNVQINKTTATTFDILTQNYNLSTLVQADFTQFCFWVLQL